VEGMSMGFETVNVSLLGFVPLKKDKGLGSAPWDLENVVVRKKNKYKDISKLIFLCIL
jgi:hypothetical protein